MSASTRANSSGPIHRHNQARLHSNFAELSDISRLTPDAACRMLQSSPAGLTARQAARRLKLHGPNLVTRERKPTIFQELWGRTRNPLNALLLTLAIVSYFLGDIRAAIVIAVMVVFAVTTEGVTPAVARLYEAIDAERLAVDAGAGRIRSQSRRMVGPNVWSAGGKPHRGREATDLQR